MRKQACLKLAGKSDIYRTWDDVEPLIERELEKVNSSADIVTGQLSITDFIEQHYLPWCQQNKSAVTANSYEKVWEHYWKSRIGRYRPRELDDGSGRQSADRSCQIWPGESYLVPHEVDAIRRLHVRHCVWGCANWRQSSAPCEVAAQNSTRGEAGGILDRRGPSFVEPLDIRAACAVALAYFAALRPAEIRGLKWGDWRGDELDVKRSVWRNKIGETKTEGSAASVPVIEPLPTLLAKLKAFYVKENCSTGPQAYIIQNANGSPLSLDSLNYRFIAPTLKKAGIAWRGYNPGRRGISSLVTDTPRTRSTALGCSGIRRPSRRSSITLAPKPIAFEQQWNRSNRKPMGCSANKPCNKKDDAAGAILSQQVALPNRSPGISEP